MSHERMNEMAQAVREAKAALAVVSAKMSAAEKARLDLRAEMLEADKAVRDTVDAFYAEMTETLA